MPPLSLAYTADTFWREAVRDLPDEAIGDILPFEKYNLINRTQQIVQGMFADLVAEAYMDSTVVADPSDGDSGTAEAASWDASASTLSNFSGLAFVSADIGKGVVFVDSATGYVYNATILEVTDGLTIVLGGYSLPTSNINDTINVVIVTGLSISANSMTIATLPMLRYGSQVKMWISSTTAENMLPMDLPALQKWRESATQNKHTVAWSLVGSAIYFRLGSSLSSYGTLTIHYPRTAIPVSASQTTIDLLDGPMAQIGIKKLRNLLAARTSLKVEVDKERDEIKELVVALYNSFGITAKKEVIAQKTEAFL
jgi:hypothetical protein